MVDRADVILTMTPSHAQAVMQMAPGAVHKVFPIDPVHPIGDPIGHPIEVYREVADQLEELVEARLKEILT
jgi:protein-tyrosine-phosphatase